MNKLKKFLIILIILILGLYGLFFVGVYAFGNLNKYIPQLKTVVKDTVGIDLDIESAKVTPTPKVEVQLTVDKIKVKYPDSKEIASLNKFSVKIPVLPIILGNIKLSEIKIDSPEAKFSMNKKGEIDLVNYLTPYLEKLNNEETPAEESSKKQSLPKYFKISTNMPDIKIGKHKIELFDEWINQTVLIDGETLNIVKFDLSKGLKVITKGKIETPNQKFAKYDLTVETFFPEMTDTKQKQKVETAFIDPFKSMRDYKFFTDIFADLKITENKTDGVNIKGNLEVKELNLKHNLTDTKGTFAKLKFDKNTIDAESTLHLTKNQKAQINAHFKYGKKNDIEMQVKSDKLELTNLLQISKALMDTLGYDNDLNLISANGYLAPNFSIKSDFKTLQSNGHIYLKNGHISHKSFPANISDINSDIDLSGNKINITNTKALVNGQPVNVEGTINQSADCDLKITSQNLSLPSLFELFADKSLKNTYKINSGILNLNVLAKGKLDKIMPKADVKIVNLNMTDKINHYTAAVPNVDVKVNTDLKTYDGNLTLGTTKLYLADLNLTTYIKNLKLNFDDKDMTINPFDIDIQNSIFKTQGKVKDYASNMKYEITTSGNIASTTVVKSFIPKEFHSMLSYKGALPVKATVTGDSSVLGVVGSIGANASNYITPLHISQLVGKPSTVKVDIKTKGNDLIINNISLDTSSAHFADIKGTVGSYSGKNPVFKNLKVNTPNNFSFSIPNMKDSSITLTSDLTIGGTMNNPAVLGNINISNLSIPEYKLKTQNLNINMTNSTIKASSNNLNLANSDFKFDMSANNNLNAKIFTINNMNLSSNNLDLVKILDIAASMPQNSNAPGTDFPLAIKSGHGTIKNFSMDAIKAQNVSADFNLLNNTISLNNLKATAYGGPIEGDLSYNLQYLRLKTKLKGKGMNANSAVTAFMGLKDQMNGNLNFNADITLSGATEKQQMQSLKGTASFVILDGQMGSLGQFEHFLYAQNLLSQSFIKTSIGSAVSKLAPKNTGKFTKMSGDIGLSNGWAQIVKLTSTGPNMSLYLTGKYNLLTNYANIDILGNISQDVANSLGAVGELSLEKITSNIPKFGMTMSKMISGYNITTSNENLKKIPQLSTDNSETPKSFKVKIDGNIESISAVKSFMWLMNEAEAEAKKRELIEGSKILDKVPNLKQEILNRTTTKTENNQNTTQTTTENKTPSTTSTSTTQTTTQPPAQQAKPLPQTKEELKNEVKDQLKQAGTEALKNQINKKLPNFLDNIGTQGTQGNKQTTE